MTVDHRRLHPHLGDVRHRYVRRQALGSTQRAGERLARLQTIVSRLMAIEELAGVDILCADKTGTLTQNSLTLGEPVVIEAKDPDELVLAASLASRQEGADAIDQAILAGLKDPLRLAAYSVTKFLPFDPVIKRAEAMVL